jgi:FAD/FMN-containing dehydrogenase
MQENRAVRHQGMNRRDLLRGAGGAMLLASLQLPLVRAATAATAEQAAIADLRAAMTGRVLEPAQGDYLAWSVSANTRFDSVLPLAVALCASEADVQACLKWATENAIPLAIRGGGHNYIGMSSTNGLLIVTRMMRQISMTEAGVATVQAGVLNGDLRRALVGGNWMLPVGTCPQVGATGLTLGGGIGINARWGGLTCDHLLSTRAISASGEALVIDSKTNPDLFWASQGGGGGNFALHTEMTYQLLEVPKTFSYFGLEFHGADASKRAYAALGRIIESAPNEFSASGFLRSSPASGKPNGSGGKLPEDRFPNMEVFGGFNGGKQDLADLIAPLLDLKPAVQTVESSDFWTAQSWLGDVVGPRHGWSDANRCMERALSEAEVDEMAALLLRAPYARSDLYTEFGLFAWVGGAVNNRAATDSAFPHRNASSILRVGARWNPDVPISAQLELNDWLDEAYGFVRKVGQAASYLNWPNERIADWKSAYYGPNLPRLVAVKQQYDSDNLFRSVQSVPVSM